MSTSIQARLSRSVGYDSFAHITPVPVVAGGIAADGVLFDGDLTDEQIGDVWWFVTSRDETDRAIREQLAALVAAAETGDCDTTWLADAFAELGRYVLGLSAT